MGFIKKVFGYTPAGLVAKEFDLFGDRARSEADELQRRQADLRTQGKRRQLELLRSKRGPVVTPQMEARIKALEDESKLPFHLDPNVQADYRRATVGGAQALSGIQNEQLASGARGGFSNVGSISDVYDRLGVQLADLGQKQQVMKEQKRDIAAAARQDIADAQIAYENSLKDAEAAIEAGDTQAMMAALNQAYAAKDAIRARSQQLLLGGIQTGVGAFAGSPGTAKAGVDNISSAGGKTYGGYQYGSPSGSVAGAGGFGPGVSAGGYKPSYQYR
jgi:hypothetical protein